MLFLYVYDVIVTSDDEEEITQLNVRLSKEFKIKDRSLFRYYLRIEITRGAEGMILSQRKYALDLLIKISMLGCKFAATPTDQKFKLSVEAREPPDRKKSEVGRYIDLSKSYVSQAVSVMSRYIHDPRKNHIKAVYQIL
jgi:Reverse transcriptase (RNA-dependent DNA polymerase)